MNKKNCILYIKEEQQIKFLKHYKVLKTCLSNISNK